MPTYVYKGLGFFEADEIQDAVAMLTQLGEQKLTARQLVERALNADATISDAGTLLAAAFRLKEIG